MFVMKFLFVSESWERLANRLVWKLTESLLLKLNENDLKLKSVSYFLGQTFIARVILIRKWAFMGARKIEFETNFNWGKAIQVYLLMSFFLLDTIGKFQKKVLKSINSH